MPEAWWEALQGYSVELLINVPGDFTFMLQKITVTAVYWKIYKVTMSKNTIMQIQCLRCLLLSSNSVEISKFERLWNRLKDFGLGFYPWHSSPLSWLWQTFTLMGNFTKLQRKEEGEGDNKNSMQEAWLEALQSYKEELQEGKLFPLAKISINDNTYTSHWQRNLR